MLAKIKSLLRPFYRYTVNLLKGFRRIGLKTNQFTIISNNCTGGYIYQFFGIQYCSPTAGLIIHPDDYIKLIRRPQHYFEVPLVFLKDRRCARHYEQWKNAPNFDNCPIGVIDDIEIFFMHYKTEEEARSKWERRCMKIRYERLFFLFVQNEWTTDRDRTEFLKVDTDRKVYLRYTPFANTEAMNRGGGNLCTQCACSQRSSSLATKNRNALFALEKNYQFTIVI